MNAHPFTTRRLTVDDELHSGVPAQVLVSPRGTLVNLFTGGDGIPVVALHGSGFQGQAWRGLLPALEGGFRLHGPDLYGYGGSAAFPGPRPATLEEEADLVGALLRCFDRPVHLAGHSYGGAVALQVAADYPRQVCSLALYEPLTLHLLKPEFGGHAPALHQVEILASSIRNACLRKQHEQAARLYIEHWCGAGGFERLPAARRSALAGQAWRLWSDMLVALAGTLSPAACRDISLPILLLSGSRSPGTARLVIERLAGTLPGARHASLPDLGHLAPLTHPAMVGRVVATFLRACEHGLQRRACA